MFQYGLFEPRSHGARVCVCVRVHARVRISVYVRALPALFCLLILPG